MIDFDLPKCSRVCSQTGRTLLPKETYYSALVEDEDGKIKRLDFSPEAWRPDAVKALGWWRSVIADPGEKRVKLAPNDILLRLFDQWIGEPKRSEFLYILALLMIRRRIFRFEKEEDLDEDRGGFAEENLIDGDSPEDRLANNGENEKKSDALAVKRVMILYSPRRETTFSVPIVPLSDERAGEIQEELASLLYSDGAANEIADSPKIDLESEGENP